MNQSSKAGKLSTNIAKGSYNNTRHEETLYASAMRCLRLLMQMLLCAISYATPITTELSLS